MISKDRQTPNEEIVKLGFSDKYSEDHASRYHLKHQQGLGRRLTNWREHRLARRALTLAGNPKSVLDIPCGAGRFWQLLCENPDRQLYGADNSEGMLTVAGKIHAPVIRDRFQLFQTSAFSIDMGNDAVENIFSMRLLHHIGKAEDRLKIYSEFYRVCSKSVCLSLWVDGNYKAYRRKKLEARTKRDQRVFQNRFVLDANMVTDEFQQAGFDVTGYLDFIPGYSMWRIYVLMKK